MCELTNEKNTLIRGLLYDGAVNLTAISAKDLVVDAQKIHGLSRVCTAALGRTLLMTSMMGVQLKSETDKVTAMVRGGGPAGNIICTGRAGGIVKGYIENPALELPLAPNGKLDVSMAVGWFGDLTVIRDLGLKEPYVGTCELFSGEIAEDFARYFTQSEQQPCLVYLGVRMDATSGDVRSAGGLMISPLPNCPDEILDVLQERASSISSLSEMLETKSLEEALNELLDGMDFHVTDRAEPAFRCDCSRERLEQVLISLGREEIKDMMEQDHQAEITCQFCNKTYLFNENDLAEILREAEDKGCQNA